MHSLAQMLPIEAKTIHARADGESEIEQARSRWVDKLERGSSVSLPGVSGRSGDCGVGMHLQPSDAIGSRRNLNGLLALRGEIKELLEDGCVVSLAIAHGASGFDIEKSAHDLVCGS